MSVSLIAHTQERTAAARESVLEDDSTRDRLALLGEKTACLVHEIKNPLLCIGGFARNLAESPNLSPEERARARMILDESRRLEQLLGSVLSFSRPAAGRTADLQVLITECLDLFRLGCPAGVRLEVAGDGPVHARADADLIRQCLINLVKNAVESLVDGGSVRLSVSQEHGWAFLRVADTGVGMDREQLARIFTPFRTTKPGGTGLGLVTTRRIVEGIGGSMSVESAPGRGTLVTIILPAA